MKALHIPTITLLLSLFIAGIQPQAAPKLPVSVYYHNFPTALTQLKATLAQEMHEINEIKESVGRSSSRAENLLSKAVKVILYLEELLEASPTDTLKCLIPGAKPDPIRGVCYLLVTNPKLLWSEANQYCHDLKGGLLAPLPLDSGLGGTLASLFPELTTSSGSLWVDGIVDVDTQTYVYQSGFDTGIFFDDDDEHLAMVLAGDTPPGNPPELIEDDEYPFICQFDAVTVLPPFNMSHMKYEDDTHIPNRKYLVDVESVNDVHHHSGENSVGYGHPNEEYHEEGHQGEGHYEEGHPEEGYPVEEKLASN